jgi:hypothetical protein
MPPIAIEVHLVAAQLGAVSREGGLGLVKLDQEGPRVDLRQQVPALDVLAFAERDAV